VIYWDESRISGRMSRRRLLLASGGLLLAGTAAALENAAADSAPRQAASAKAKVRPRQRPAPTASLPPRPAKPVYYVDDGAKTIALTIDDGPSPIYTPQILRILKQYGIAASFSMIGSSVVAYPGVAREVAAAGHTIINHTWNHADLAPLRPSAVKDEITRATDAIHDATDVRPGMFRAPYGAWSPAILQYCAEAEMIPVDWSVDPQDWAMPGVASIVENIMRNTQTGSIILEHDGGGNRSQTVAALRIVIPRLLRAGYQFRAP
jgi:peptidoglycan-N-acetylglucosamine deacetylase